MECKLHTSTLSLSVQQKMELRSQPANNVIVMSSTFRRLRDQSEIKGTLCSLKYSVSVRYVSECCGFHQLHDIHKYLIVFFCKVYHMDGTPLIPQLFSQIYILGGPVNLKFKPLMSNALH